MKQKLFEIESQLANLRHYVWTLRPNDFITTDKEQKKTMKPVHLTKEHLHEIDAHLRTIEKSLDEVMKEMS